MAEYIEKQAAIDALGEEPEIWCETDEEAATQSQWEMDKVAIESVPPADVVSWAYLERYANWFCADVTFPEFIREAKAFLKASGGFQEGNEIYD